MGVLAPLGSGWIQLVIIVLGGESRPWHCTAFVNCLLTTLDSSRFEPAPFTSPVERSKILNVGWT